MFTKRNPDSDNSTATEATTDVSPASAAATPVWPLRVRHQWRPLQPAPLQPAQPPQRQVQHRQPHQRSTSYHRVSTAEPAETGKLHVGREIKLKGEIGVCERLIVEGSVDATLMECRSMEVAPGGFFTGQAQVDTAEISGHFEGELTVEGLLTVTSTGRLSGNVSFGELQVERGGTITGSIEIAGSTSKANVDCAAALVALKEHMASKKLIWIAPARR